MKTFLEIVGTLAALLGWGAFWYYVMWLATDGNVIGSRGPDEGPLFGPNWRPGGFGRIYNPPPWIR